MLKQVLGSPRQASRPRLPVGLVNFLPLSLSFCCSPFFNLAISVAAPRYGYGHLFLLFPTRPLTGGTSPSFPASGRGRNALRLCGQLHLVCLTGHGSPWGFYPKRCWFLHTHTCPPLWFQEAVPGALKHSVFKKGNLVNFMPL